MSFGSIEGVNGTATYDAVTRTVSWIFDELNDGQTRKLQINVSIDPGCACETIINEATVTATTIEDGNPANNHVSNLFNYPYTLKTVNQGLVVTYIPWGVIDDYLPVTVGVDGMNASKS